LGLSFDPVAAQYCRRRRRRSVLIALENCGVAGPWPPGWISRVARRPPSRSSDSRRPARGKISDRRSALERASHADAATPLNRVTSSLGVAMASAQTTVLVPLRAAIGRSGASSSFCPNCVADDRASNASRRMETLHLHVAHAAARRRHARVRSIEFARMTAPQLRASGRTSKDCPSSRSYERTCSPAPPPILHPSRWPDPSTSARAPWCEPGTVG